MEETLALELVRAFVAKINAHQADGLYELMTNDHRCVDAFGTAVQGREMVRQAWRAYFLEVPDYHIACEQVISGGTTIAIFGTVSGTVSQAGHLAPAQRWEVPAAWNVVVRGTRVAAWQVYMDTHPLRQQLARRGSDVVDGEAPQAGGNPAHSDGR